VIYYSGSPVITNTGNENSIIERYEGDPVTTGPPSYLLIHATVWDFHIPYTWSAQRQVYDIGFVNMENIRAVSV